MMIFSFTEMDYVNGVRGNRLVYRPIDTVSDSGVLIDVVLRVSGSSSFTFLVLFKTNST